MHPLNTRRPDPARSILTSGGTSPGVPYRVPVVVELCPLEEGAVLPARRVAGLAHPKVPPAVLPPLLDDAQHGRDATRAPGRVPRVQAGLVVAVRDVDAPVAGHGVRVDGMGWRDAVLPGFLHLGVHDQQRVVRQVDGDLARGVGIGVPVLGHDPPDAKLPGHTQGERPYDGAGPEVGELVRVPAYGLGGAVVAVDERGVGGPRWRGLVPEFGCPRVVGPDALLDLLVDGLLD